MTEGLRIRIVDPGDDYLGIEIQVSNGRFAGSTRIFAGLEQLTEFSAKIAGFPTNPDDERIYESGSRESKIAGGYGRMRFHCIDHKGHAAIEVILEDDDKYYSAASARLSLQLEAADIDRFIKRLRELQKERSGEAVLSSSV
jgi:hypothetical protein